MNMPGSFDRTGKAHAADPGVGCERSSYSFSRARKALQYILGYTRLVHQFRCPQGHQRRLLCGFCDHAITRGEGRTDLPGENGQRKIPGRDAGKDPPWGDRPRKIFCPACVVTEKIDRFADLGNPIEQSFPGLTAGKRHQFGKMGLIKICSPVEPRTTHTRRKLPPGTQCTLGPLNGRVDIPG